MMDIDKIILSHSSLADKENLSSIESVIERLKEMSLEIHSGEILELSHSLPHSIDALTFNLFPGCRKDLERDCTSKYNNSSSFLGLGKWAPKQERAF